MPRIWCQIAQILYFAAFEHTVERSGLPLVPDDLSLACQPELDLVVERRCAENRTFLPVRWCHSATALDPRYQ